MCGNSMDSSREGLVGSRRTSAHKAQHRHKVEVSHIPTPTPLLSLSLLPEEGMRYRWPALPASMLPASENIAEGTMGGKYLQAKRKSLVGRGSRAEALAEGTRLIQKTATHFQGRAGPGVLKGSNLAMQTGEVEPLLGKPGSHR